MHKSNEFAQRFAERLAERQYTDDELMPRDEASTAAGHINHVRETSPRYGDATATGNEWETHCEDASEGGSRRPPKSSRVRLSDPSAAPARRRPR